MFSTILDKVTGYFDRHSLITSFFPSLIFWALSSVLVIAFQWNWQNAIAAWDKLSGTLQFLLFFAFFIWVAFWSFLTANFRTSFTRLFEGYWPSIWPFSQFYTWKRVHWQQRWSDLNTRDNELGGQEGLLLSEHLAYQKLRDSLMSNQIAASQPGGDADQIGHELDTFLDQLEAKVQALDISRSPSLPEIQTLGMKARNWLQTIAPWRQAEATQHASGDWTQRYHRLEKCTERLDQEVEMWRAEVQVQRQPLYRDISLYFPSDRSDIMPTRLGNVLKAAETYPWKRYRLDAVVIWSRMESSIPDAFSTTFENAKISLDLMITLATCILFFGIPWAAWIVVHNTMMLSWWLPLILALIALALRLYIFAGIAVLACLAPVFLASPPIALARTQIAVILLVGIAILFWLCYQNAVQAALAYGEQIKSAFDLYRWKVLEALHLQLPKDLDEERKTWEAVDGLLLRNYRPDARYYRYVQPEKTEVKKDATSSPKPSDSIG
jgi:hypothetical protein